MHRIRRGFLTTGVAVIYSVVGFSQSTLPYKDASLSVEERLADLLGRMTLEEKVGQLICPLGWPMYDKVSDDSVRVSDTYREFIDKDHGGMLWATFRADPWTKKTLETGLTPELSAKAYNELQRYAIENSRLGIPVILAEEAPHGHMAIGTTVFPTGIGMASTFSRETMEKTGNVVAEELRAQGAHIGYGPVVDLAREPRWSRVEETLGEDTYLTSEMAAALMQGNSVKNIGFDKGILPTMKHFVAYGNPEGGHNGNQTVVGPRDLKENYFPTFEKGVQNGAMSIMTSYNSIDGVPSTANGEYLTDLLRGEWGFDGFVVSDLESVDGLHFTHHIARNRQEAAEMALTAGVDVDLGAHCYPLLVESVKEDKIDESLIDRAAGNVLRQKFLLGLFDNPYIREEGVEERVSSPAHREAALNAARQSVTLLENKNKILPLRKNIKVAVIGPNADNIYNQLGDYTAPQPDEKIVTVVEGIVEKIGADNVEYVKGCAIRDTSGSEIEAAVKAASEADVAVVVVGGSSARDFKTSYLDTGAAVVDANTVSDMESGEGFDRASLDLLGDQLKLLEAVKATGTPMVVVYIEGRPLDKNWAKENADALLTAWYPGEQGGNAIADVLFGDYNPAGRLPISVPRNVGQLPVYYNKRIPRGHDYVEMSADPLYEFGYGLSYTDFEYSDLKVSKGEDEVKVSFKVTNKGDRDGDEVSQVYFIDPIASTVRPAKQLCEFARTNIPAGKSVTLDFSIPLSTFALYDRKMNKVVEPGEIIIEVGSSSKEIRLSGELAISN
ncbi:MAG: glycoside hydrolase family 3 C-terminal domain-containing protein [Muribaculaceae bacterium]|nr:glycoside hydrolase family 3 C-terminal domain-containing protein [Muribaculaceae bacterium]